MPAPKGNKFAQREGPQLKQKRKGEMKEMKHTPGPWKAFPGKNEHGEKTINIQGIGQFIATMDTVSGNGKPFALPKNGEANARLIAAAPELLEALERFMSYENFDMITGNDVDVARQAIAKAKGQD